MRKAVLVLDEMPEGCYEPDICPFRGADAETDEYICLITEEKIAYEGRPDWCPLKEAPEFESNFHITDEDIQGMADDYEMSPEYMTGHENGWNDCLKEIIETRD